VFIIQIEDDLIQSFILGVVLQADAIGSRNGPEKDHGHVLCFSDGMLKRTGGIDVMVDHNQVMVSGLL